MGVGGQRDAPAFLPLEKTWYLLYRRPGGPQGQSGQVWKTLPPPGFDPWTVQPVASRYTDCAILAHSNTLFQMEIFSLTFQGMVGYFFYV
jgi:hypothetical protein